MDELLNEPVKLTEEMKGGLARLYADDGIRAYILNAMAISNKNVLTCLKSNKSEEAKEYAARLDALEKLLEKGKAVYQHAEKLRSRSLEEQLQDKEENNENQG